MKKTKSALSLLLAVIMVFSVFSVGISAAEPPIVPREGIDLPRPIISVPEYITVQGDNRYTSGSNVQGGKSITFELAGATGVRIDTTITDLVLGIGGDPSVSGNKYTWSILGTATAGTYETIKFSYIYNRKTYITYTYIWVDYAHGDAGVTNNTSQENTWLIPIGTSSSSHTLSVTNSYGSHPSTSDGGYQSGYFNYDSKSFTAVSSATSGGIQWTASADHDYNVSGHDTLNMDVNYRPTATVYVNTAAGYTNMNETNVNFNVFAHGHTIDGKTVRSLENLNITANSAYSTSFTGSFWMEMDKTYSYKLNGPVPTAGSSVTMVLNDEALARIRTIDGGGGASVDRDYTANMSMYVKLIGYDKSSLKGLVNSEILSNRQQADLGDKWSAYLEAYRTAFCVLGKPNATQNEINSAYNTLYYIISSGLIGDQIADYSAVDAILTLIPRRDVSKYYYTHPEYYTAATRSALDDAIADIAYDRPLSVEWQHVVNQMATNLRTAMNAMVLDTFDIGIVSQATESFSQSVSYVVLSDVTHPGIPVREGYNFVGWFYDEEFTEPVTFPFTMPAKDFTIYAKWSRITSTIRFNANGGSAIDNFIGGVGDNYTGPTQQTTKYGYDFDCWCLDSALTTPVNWETFVIPTNGRTIYARWTLSDITVSFETFGGSVVADAVGKYNTEIEQPSSPTKFGSRFDAWYYDEQCKLPVEWPLTLPGEDLTLYAGWISNQYTISFDCPEDATGAPETVWASSGQTIYQPTNPKRTGYGFTAWYYDEEFTSKVTWPLTMSTNNIVLYSKWTASTARMTYSNSMAGVKLAVTNVSGKTGDLLDKPADPTILNPATFEYLFVGWANSDGDIVTWPYALPAGRTTLYATWRPMPDLATFTLDAVKVNADGTPDPSAVQLAQGDVVEFTANLETNYNIGSFSTVIFYDRNYFEPALDRESYTDRFFGSITNDLGFFKRGDNSDEVTATTNGYNAWQVGGKSVRGSVNNSTNIKSYYPYSWRLNNTTLKSEYSMYDYVWFSVTATSNTNETDGYCMIVYPEQKIFTFRLRVKDDAPSTPSGTYTRVTMPTDAIYGDSLETSGGQINVVKKSGDSILDESTMLDIEYDLTDATRFFQISEKERYTITFNTNGADPIDNMIVAEGYTVDLPEIEHPNEACYFAGWAIVGEGDEIVSDPFTMPSGNVSLIAVWETDYSVTYWHMDIYGENYEIDETVITRGILGKTVYAETPAVTGFELNDAFTAPGLSGTVTYLDDGLKLNVYYDRLITTITFLGNGGELSVGYESYTRYYDTAIIAPPQPKRTGYSFIAWTLNGNAYHFDKMPANDITLVAMWDTVKYTISFFVDDEENARYTFTAKYGDPITFPDMKVEGLKFNGWYADMGYYRLFEETTMPNSNQNLFGYYEESSVILTFNIDGRDLATTFKAEEGDPIVFPDTDKEGYAFSGWFTNQTCTRAFTSTVMPSSSMRIYGRYSLQKYTVSYFLYDEDEEDFLAFGTPVTTDFNSVIVLPQVSVETGFKFSGWYVDENLSEAYVLGRMPAKDFSLYGKIVPAQYTVSFYIDGVLQDHMTITEYYGNEIILPSPATDDVHDFDGWYTSPEMTVKSELNNAPAYMPPNNVNLYGTLITATLTITYYLDGVYHGTKDILYGEPIVHIKTPTKADATFDKWYSNVEMTVPFTDTLMPGYDISLFGTFIPDPATVSFNVNGGVDEYGEAGVAPDSIETGVGLTINLPKAEDINFSKANYVFAGWGETPNTVSTSAFTDTYKVPSGGAVLYAVWKAQDVAIVPTKNSMTVIDSGSSYIYGLKAGITYDELINDYLTVTGNGSLRFSNTSVIGTGTQISLYNENTGNVVQTFTVIIYGDINGDGIVDTNDATTLNRAAAFLTNITGYRAFAADLNKDGFIDTYDATIVNRTSALLSTINQADPTR